MEKDGEKGDRLTEGQRKLKKKDRPKKESDADKNRDEKDGQRERKRQKQRGRVSNYRTPTVFKAPLLCPLFLWLKKEKQRKGRGGGGEGGRLKSSFSPTQTTGTSRRHHTDTNTNTLNVIYSLCFKRSERICVRESMCARDSASKTKLTVVSGGKYIHRSTVHQYNSDVAYLYLRYLNIVPCYFSGPPHL